MSAYSSMSLHASLIAAQSVMSKQACSDSVASGVRIWTDLLTGFCFLSRDWYVGMSLITEIGQIWVASGSSGSDSAVVCELCAVMRVETVKRTGAD